MDIALARERAIGSTEAGPEPDPCRSPGAERNLGTFLDGRCPPVSFLQDVPQGCAEPGPRLALPPAAGWCRPHCKDTDVASAHRQAWGVQSHISDLYGCTNQKKTHNYRAVTAASTDTINRTSYLTENEPSPSAAYPGTPFRSQAHNHLP